ncbi:hypothetical protein ABIE38_000241 [Dietzia sp. 2505]
MRLSGQPREHEIGDRRHHPEATHSVDRRGVRGQERTQSDRMVVQRERVRHVWSEQHRGAGFEHDGLAVDFQGPSAHDHMDQVWGVVDVFRVAQEADGVLRYRSGQVACEAHQVPPG